MKPVDQMGSNCTKFQRKISPNHGKGDKGPEFPPSGPEEQWYCMKKTNAGKTILA